MEPIAVGSNQIQHLSIAKASRNQTMSIARRRAIVSLAETKFDDQRARPEGDLRRLLGHVTLIQSLHLEISKARNNAKRPIPERNRTEVTQHTFLTRNGTHVKWLDLLEDSSDDEEANLEAEIDFLGKMLERQNVSLVNQIRL
jgi:hypothetical protein